VSLAVKEQRQRGKWNRRATLTEDKRKRGNVEEKGERNREMQ
jgi:hypothetical protein